MNADEIHRQSILIDATCPLLLDRSHLALYRQGGFTAVTPTVNGWDGAARAFGTIGSWLREIDDRDDLILVRKADDVLAAKQSGRLGIIFHFQGTEPIEQDPDLLDAYQAAGVRIIQLAYNVKNRIGDGCEERTDCGLSRFGLKVVERMNRVGILVDCAHTGYRTTLDAMAASSSPVIFSHANAFAVHPSPRNIRDEQARTLAGTGGVIGVVGFPAFVSAATVPSLDQFIDHIVYYASAIGIEHVGLGLDYFVGQHGIASEGDAARSYAEDIASERWGESYPPPPYHYPAGIEMPNRFANLTRRLIDRDFTSDDIVKVLGGNWLRVFREVWG